MFWASQNILFEWEIRKLFSITFLIWRSDILRVQRLDFPNYNEFLPHYKCFCQSKQCRSEGDAATWSRSYLSEYLYLYVFITLFQIFNWYFLHFTLHSYIAIKCLGCLANVIDAITSPHHGVTLQTLEVAKLQLISF